MVFDKQLLACKVYSIAEKLNIQQVTVHTVITKFLEHQREELLNGVDIVFLGIVSVYPTPSSSRYKGTLAYTASKIAFKLGIPDGTVLEILKEYMKTQKEDLLSGKSIDFRGIVSVHPILDDETKTYSARATISPSIRESIAGMIEIGGNKVNAVRASTSRSLKLGMQNFTKSE